MSDDHGSGESDLQQQVDDLRESVIENRLDTESLTDRADESEARADKAELRAEDHQAQAEQVLLRVEHLERHVEIDRAMILELQVDGLVGQAKVENLEVALRSARVIGEALGIVMSQRKVDEREAFALLAQASKNANRKVRLLAEDIVRTGDLDQLSDT